MLVTLFADATTFWTAVGAIGSMIAAVAAVAIALIYTRRQTDLTDRAAQNARTSAVAAVDAARIAADALTVASGQLEIARSELAMTRASLELAIESFRASERPVLMPIRLTWDGTRREFILHTRNDGRGGGIVVAATLYGPGAPPGFEIPMHGLPRLIPIEQDDDVAFSAPVGLLEPPVGFYVVVASVANAARTETRTVEWEFDGSRSISLAPLSGRIRAVHSQSIA